jgi:hypothetical protein
MLFRSVDDVISEFSHVPRGDRHLNIDEAIVKTRLGFGTVLKPENGESI